MTPYQDAVQKHGGIMAASRALGLAKSTLQSRLKKEQESPILPPKPPKSNKPTLYKIVYFTDAHNQPGLPIDRFIWLAKFINDQKPDAVVDGGDFDDFQSLCSHERDETYKGRLKPLLQADLEAAAIARKAIKDNLTHSCRMVVTFGNHENRLMAYENNNPAMFGIVSNLYYDILKSTGWEYHPYGAYVNVHGVDFTHSPFNAMGRPLGGETACKQIADKSTNDICFGHSHNIDMWNAPKFGASKSVTAFNGGCFMPDGYVPDYSKNVRKEFWYGAHVITVGDGKIKSIKSWHMSELEELYGS